MGATLEVPHLGLLKLFYESYLDGLLSGLLKWFYDNFLEGPVSGLSMRATRSGP